MLRRSSDPELTACPVLAPDLPLDLLLPYHLSRPHWQGFQASKHVALLLKTQEVRASRVSLKTLSPEPEEPRQKDGLRNPGPQVQLPEGLFLIEGDP
ncbi:unnamed protein product, partial [Rangifer tarandus platyrhynchus]